MIILLKNFILVVLQYKYYKVHLQLYRKSVNKTGNSRIKILEFDLIISKFSKFNIN